MGPNGLATACRHSYRTHSEVKTTLAAVTIVISGQWMHALIRIRNLEMKSSTFGSVSEDSFVTRKNFVSSGVIPRIFLQLLISPDLCSSTRNLVIRNSVVAEKLRPITHRAELSRFRSASMKTFSATNLKRSTEAHVTSCPTLARLTVSSVLQTTLTRSTMTTSGAQNREVLGKTRR